MEGSLFWICVFLCIVSVGFRRFIFGTAYIALKVILLLLLVGILASIVQIMLGG